MSPPLPRSIPRMSVTLRILGPMDSKVPPSLRRTISEQADVVSRQQLLRAGVPRTTIDSRVQRGIWQQFHPGVYGTFTGVARWEARLWAAVLYAGPDALLSHETAAEVLGLTNRRHPVIQLTVPARRRVRPQEGLAIHRSALALLPVAPSLPTPPAPSRESECRVERGVSTRGPPKLPTAFHPGSNLRLTRRPRPGP
jgi:putative AbiEi antitoxin of type IV toxin-antitoxin system